MDADFILAINPGATSTKIAVYRSNKFVFLKTIRHDCEELRKFEKTADQMEFRMELVLSEVRENHIPFEQIGMIIGRGGLIHPIESGVYEVNEAMVKDLEAEVMGDHASNLGGLIAFRLIGEFPNAKAYIADPVVVDELQEVARLSGHPEFRRISIFHALNQKATARTYAHSRGMEYEDLNLIVAHLGSGISVGAHKKGRVVDVNNALDGEGPFGPERSGTLPAGALAGYCFREGVTAGQVRSMIIGEGGLYAYLGHKDALRLERKAREGNRAAKLIQDAMAYQISKQIGSMAAALGGEVHAIIITGGMAHNPDLTGYIKEHVAFIAPVFIYPGEDEMRALALNGSLLQSGKITPKEYRPENLVGGLDPETLEQARD
ncbi:MAG: butyrate kinase [Bacteroidetes bacterium]|nr:MAG: butyrate kinase [Bacteroidota bacterium]